MGDQLIEEGAAEALAPELVVHADVEDVEGLAGGVGGGGGEGGQVAVVLGGQGEAFVGTREDLLEGEAVVFGKGIGVDALLAERALFESPGEGEAFAGAVEVEVVGGLDGGVEVEEVVEVGELGGAEP